MVDRQMRMLELGLQGFGCSQILLMMALEAQGKGNEDLVRAVSGLQGGLGITGKTCGALTGGCCVLGLHAGKGKRAESDDARLLLMTQTLVDWFEKEYEPRFGGTDCADILQDEPRNRHERCPEIVGAVFDKVAEILSANGYDLKKGPGATR
jgi:C_GCAxxG_C_C family probable redox protein